MIAPEVEVVAGRTINEGDSFAYDGENYASVTLAELANIR